MPDYCQAWLECEKLLRDEEARSRKLLEALTRIEKGWHIMESDELSDIARDAIASYEQSKQKEELK